MYSVNRESRLVKWGTSITGIIAVLVAWELASATFGIVPKLVLPPPTQIWGTFFEFQDLMMSAFLSTLEVSAVGWFSVIILGVFWGSVFAMYEEIYETFMPLVVSVNSIPRVALAPVILFYVSDWFNPAWAKYAISIWVAFFALFVNVIEGLDANTTEQHYLFDSLGATKWQKYKKLQVWNAMPHFLDGLKLATTGAIVGAVVGEYVRAQEGIGALVLFNLASVQYDVVFAAVGLMSLVSVAVVLAIFVVQEKAIYWQETELFS